MAEASSSSTKGNSLSANAPSSEVYAVFGAEPEVQAYAMAKYSRSALSMKESLKEISAQKAEKFLNTFYLQYGHRSIADLALWTASFQTTNHSPKKCSATWLKSRPSPPR